MDINPLDFDLPKHRSSAIKVIGVGGGGSNAVNYMKNQGIRGVDFIICNTDGQALAHSPVETKIQLGATLTEGLGAGANPEVGEQAALESYAEIQAALGTQTKMVFITAGMGGGTGTGAAPIIAKAARELGILTVGIVTAPFAFEGNMRLRQAEQGVERLREHVDSLIVINNNKLREVYGNLGFKQGFMKADEVLSTAARGIAEVITHHYSVNIDLRDAKTVLHNSGTAIMGSAKAAGSTRALTSVRSALDSPLLNDNHIEGARYVLLLIVSGTGEHEVTLDEIGEINDYIQEQAGRQVDIIMGIGEDAHLSDAIQVTVIATGFNSTNPIGMVKPAEPEKVVYELRPDSNPGSQFNLFDEPVRSSVPVEPQQSPVEVPLSEAHTAPEPVTNMPLVEAPVAAAEPIAWEPAALEPAAPTAFELAPEEPMTFEEPMAIEQPFDIEGVAEEPVVIEHAADEVVLEEMSFELGDNPEWAPETPVNETPTYDEEPAPTMTWTLDWDDDITAEEPMAFEPVANELVAHEPVANELVAHEPVANEPVTNDPVTNDPVAEEPIRKTVGLDELLAFEAQLRGDVPAPIVPQPEALETFEATTPIEAPVESSFDAPIAEAIESSYDEPIAESVDATFDAPLEEAIEASFDAPIEAPMSFEQPEFEVEFEAPVREQSSFEAAAHTAAPQVPSEIRVEVRSMVAEREPVQIDPDRDSLEDTMRRMAQERRAYLQAYSHRFGQAQQRIQQGDMDRPAFERQGWNLDASTTYSKEQSLGEHMVRGEKNDLEFRPHNSFLHDNVD
jgi:cell division protein FtsZ